MGCRSCPGQSIECIGLVYQAAYASGMYMEESKRCNHRVTVPNGWYNHDANNVWNYGMPRGVCRLFVWASSEKVQRGTFGPL